MKPYLQLMRFSKPIGTWLLMFPCWWGLALASPDLPSLWHMALFFAGAFIMRGAGCVYNDMVDRKFDARVARTAKRPLASGELSSLQGGFLLAFLSAVGLLILLQFPPLVVGLGVASLALILGYPWMKRITYWPQLFLGFTFNWGALMGWATLKESLDWPALALYGAGIFWTLAYDTIYAHQDKEDDLLVGIKSSALALGDRTKPFLWACYSLTLALLGLSGWLVDLAWPFYVGLFAVAMPLSWQILTLDITNPHNCWRRFSCNAEVGFLIFASIVIGVVFN